jgi:hypothetical protein
VAAAMAASSLSAPGGGATDAAASTMTRGSCPHGGGF